MDGPHHDSELQSRVQLASSGARASIQHMSVSRLTKALSPLTGVAHYTEKMAVETVAKAV